MASTENLPELTTGEEAALHRAGLGIEWLRRAHGSLVEFHHATGHAMDHLYEAEKTLRECGHAELADKLRDDLLSKGAVDDRWTYDLVESFDEGLLADATAIESGLRETLADGERHITERKQERRWKRRANDE